jgi:hypothetical protein
MITIANVNNQLEVTRDSVIEYYSFADIKSVTPYYSPVAKFSTTSGESYVVINFINENRNSSLKLPLSLLSDYSSVEQVVTDINAWIGSSLSTPEPVSKKAHITRFSDEFTFNEICSISISNVGSADGTVNGQTLKAGETVNFDAGAVNNTFSDSFNLYSTDTEFLVIYITN